MKFLAIGDTRQERGNRSYGHKDITDIYVFNNPALKEHPVTEKLETFIQVSPQNDDYTMWESTKYPEGGETELRKKDIRQSRHGIKRPRLQAIGINKEKLFELNENSTLEGLFEQTRIMPEHLYKILEISETYKLGSGKTLGSFQPCPVEHIGMAR